MKHGSIHIILIDLWLADEDEVWTVDGDEMFETKDVPEEAFDIPSHCTKCIELDSFLWSLSIYC